MGIRTFLKNRPLIEVVFWTLMFIGEIVPELHYQPVHVALLGTLIYLIPMIVSVHFGYHLYTKLRDKKYGWPLLLGIIALLIVAAPAINYLVFNACFPRYAINWPFIPYILMKIPIATTIIGGVIIILFTLDAWMEEFTAQADLKNEKLLTELHALKSQINPHFLFNTLNNIYYYACLQHPDTPAMIEKLSEILRYLVYEGEKEWVSVRQELAILDHLIDLYKVKNTSQKNITFHQEGFQSGDQVAPLLLLNLLENAFKHSDALTNPNGFIKVEAIAEGEQLTFSLSNSVKQDHVPPSSNGVGHLNIEKQIELIYPDQFSLETRLQDQVYYLELTLPIHKSVAYAIPDPYRG